MPHARNPDEPLLVGIAMPRLRKQFKRRPDVRVAARTQSRRAGTRWNCYAEVAQAIQMKARRQSCRTHAITTSRGSLNCSTKVAQAIQTKARRQSCRTHAIPTSRYSLELLCRGCAGNSNEGQTSELPHARNHDEPRLVGIALPRLRRQCKRRLGVRVAGRTQSRRAATRWNCSAKVAQAMQTKARRQSCRTHAIPTSRCSLELLCQGCAGNTNEGQTSELPHARNHDEPLLVGIALPRLRRQCKRRLGVRVAARTQSRRGSNEQRLVGIACVRQL